jgi:hypothetical protein
MEAPPDKMKYAAIAQIISGLVNIFVTSWVVCTMVQLGGAVCGSVLMVVTLGLCPVGYFVGCLGYLGFLAVPLGIVEIIAGILGLTNPKSGGTMMKITAILEIAGLLIGALPGAVAGGLVLMFLSDDQVKAYLAAPE